MASFRTSKLSQTDISGEKDALATRTLTFRTIADSHDQFVWTRKLRKLHVKHLLTPLIMAIISTTTFCIKSAWNDWKPREEPTSAAATLCQVVFWCSSACSIICSGLEGMKLMTFSWTYIRTFLVIVIITVFSVAVVVIEADGLTLHTNFKFWTESLAMACWTFLTILYLMVFLGDEVQGKLGYVTGIRTMWRRSLYEQAKAANKKHMAAKKKREALKRSKELSTKKEEALIEEKQKVVLDV